jgi:hypothetical protein
MGDAADGGKFWVSENENGLPTVTSSTELFLQWRGLSPRQTLQKIALEQALALELPPEVPQDFPSPFELNTQWGSSMLIGQEVTGTVQTTGATPDSSESDRR